MGLKVLFEIFCILFFYLNTKVSYCAVKSMNGIGLMYTFHCLISRKVASLHEAFSRTLQLPQNGQFPKGTSQEVHFLIEIKKTEDTITEKAH